MSRRITKTEISLCKNLKEKQFTAKYKIRILTKELNKLKNKNKFYQFLF